MPRITETLKQQLDTANEHFAKTEDRLGGIITNYVNSRALIEIADALKDIESHLATIAKSSEDRSTSDRTTLEEMPPAGSRSRKK